MRGRKPIPSVLADLHGNPRDRKPPKHEPKPVGDLTDPPDWMTPEQQGGWRYALEHAPTGLLKRIDRGILAVWVAAEALHRDALIAVAQQGMLTKAPKSGLPMQSPYLSIANRQAFILMKAASELGFSPVSRPRIGAAVSTVKRNHDGEAPRQSLEDFLASAPGALN